jgi:hypothetical protein
LFSLKTTYRQMTSISTQLLYVCLAVYIEEPALATSMNPE